MSRILFVDYRREYYFLGNFPGFLCVLCSASMAQHIAVNPHKQQSKYAPIRARQCKQAHRVGSSQLVVIFLFSSLCILKTGNEEIEIYPADKNIRMQPLQPFTKQLSWCDVASTLFFFSVLSVPSMHAAPGLFYYCLLYTSPSPRDS